MNRLGELDPFPLSLPLHLHGNLSPHAFKPYDEADAHSDQIHDREPGRQYLLLTRIEIQSSSSHHAHEGVNNCCGRCPDHDQPERIKDDGKSA